MTKYSMGNYIAGFVGGVPALILPIIILNNLGAKFSAYFYMDMMIANLLYIIPTSVSQTLFAEGSYNELELKNHFIKSSKIIYLILIPLIIFIIIFGKYILLAFGRQYSVDGFLLLQIFAFSGIFVSINALCGSILQVKHKIKELIWINFAGALLILLLNYLLISQALVGIGIAWLIGHVIIAFVYLIYIFKNKLI